MTALLAIITIALITTGASPWAITIAAVCAIWALTLDTRAHLITQEKVT